MIDLPKSLRLRIFAGPNGSGKSTVIKSIRAITENGHALDFGIYINADDIAQQLRKGELQLRHFSILDFTWERFGSLAESTGIVPHEISMDALRSSISIRDNKVKLLVKGFAEEAAMVLAACIREELLAMQKRFSFETVFSHQSKIEFIKKATKAGYKVYLYFVGTSSPEINIFRVSSRVKKGGHNVLPEKIIKRYYRSLDLMWEAAQHCYRVYFFDNSSEGKESELFANFKLVDGKKSWDIPDKKVIPEWFYRYYIQKANTNATEIE